MHWQQIHDPAALALLRRAEERVAAAHAFAARRASLRDSHAPRRRVRVWIGSVLLAVGHSLLRSAAKRHASASPQDIGGAEP